MTWDSLFYEVKSLEMDGEDGCPTVSMFNATEWDTSKIMKMVNFTLGVVCPQKENKSKRKFSKLPTARSLDKGSPHVSVAPGNVPRNGACPGAEDAFVLIEPKRLLPLVRAAVGLTLPWNDL